MVTKITPQPLDTVIGQLQRRYGYRAIHAASEVTTHPKTLSTGLAALDEMLKGGFIVGGVNVIVGQPTSGATSLTYKIIGAMQAAGSVVVYVDVSQLFDVRCAAQLGVNNDRLLLTYSDKVVDSLNLIRDIAAFRYHCVVVLDMGIVPLTYSLAKLQISLHQSTTTAIVLSQTPVPDATLRLHIRRQELLRQRRKITGYTLKVALEKHPTLSPRHTLLQLQDVRHA